MKIALLLITAGLTLLPLKELAAYDAVGYSNSAANKGQSLASVTRVNNNDKQTLKVRSRKQATEMLKKRYNAKVLSVQSAKVNGNQAYKAKLLSSDGIVFFVYIDAVTGQMSRA